MDYVNESCRNCAIVPPLNDVLAESSFFGSPGKQRRFKHIGSKPLVYLGSVPLCESIIPLCKSIALCETRDGEAEKEYAENKYKTKQLAYDHGFQQGLTVLTGL